MGNNWKQTEQTDWDEALIGANGVSGGQEPGQPGEYVDAIFFAGQPSIDPDTATEFGRKALSLQKLNANRELQNPDELGEISSGTIERLQVAEAYFNGLRTQEGATLARQAKQLALLTGYADAASNGMAPDKKREAVQNLHTAMHGSPLTEPDINQTRQEFMQRLGITAVDQIVGGVKDLRNEHPVKPDTNLNELAEALISITKKLALATLSHGDEDRFLRDLMKIPRFGVDLQINEDLNLGYAGYSTSWVNVDGQGVVSITLNPNRYQSYPELAQFLAHEGFPGHAMNAAVILAMIKARKMHPAAGVGVMAASGRVTLLEGIATSTSMMIGDQLSNFGISEEVYRIFELNAQWSNLLRRQALALIVNGNDVNAGQITQQLSEEFGLPAQSIAKYVNSLLKLFEKNYTPANPGALLNELFHLFYFPNYSYGADVFRKGMAKDINLALRTAWEFNGATDIQGFKKATGNTFR